MCRLLLAVSIVPLVLLVPLAGPSSAIAPPGATAVSFRPAAGSDGYAILGTADGKRLVAGRAGGDFGLLRFERGDVPDAYFGGDGRVTTDFWGRQDVAYAVAQGSTGSMAAAGTSSGDWRWLGTPTSVRSTGALAATAGS